MYPITAEGVDKMYAPNLYLIDTAAGALTAFGLVMLTYQLGQKTNVLSLKILTFKPLVLLGTFAYSIYLIHSPVIKLMFMLIKAISGTGDNKTLALLMFLVGTPIIIILSYAFYLLFERPFLTKKPAKL